jgi:hypothetical membrane protein
MQIFINIKKFTCMMIYSNIKVAGVLFFIASTQFVLGMIIAEALYPGYSISANYISDLGVGPSSTVFNVSIFLLGLLSLIGTYFLYQAYNLKVITILLIITALASMGVGIFTEDNNPMHMFVSFFAFLFGGLSAISSNRLMKHPFSIIVILLGVMSLSALFLFMGNFYFGLGAGGMERMVAYPILIWMIGFGSFLIAFPEKS